MVQGKGVAAQCSAARPSPPPQAMHCVPLALLCVQCVSVSGFH
jgi:hypothetical protein